MTKSVVGLALDRIGKDFLGLREGSKLGPGPVVVVDVRVILTHLLAKGRSDLVLTCVRSHAEKIVEILSHERSLRYPSLIFEII